METTITTSERIIMASEQLTCDVCGQPATSSCVDAIQLAGSIGPGRGWGQSTPRHGCNAHPVKPQIFFKDAAMTWEDYAKS